MLRRIILWRKNMLTLWNNPKRKHVVCAKNLTKGQIVIYHRNWSVFIVVRIMTWQRTALFVPKKYSSFNREKMLDVKIGTLEERFTNLALFGQNLDSRSTSVPKVSSFIPDYYIFIALKEVVYFTAVTPLNSYHELRMKTHGDLWTSYELKTIVPLIKLARYFSNCLLNLQMLFNLTMVVVQIWRLQI